MPQAQICLEADLMLCDTTKNGVLSPKIWHIALNISTSLMQGIYVALTGND
jgi:hypothetical protein